MRFIGLDPATVTGFVALDEQGNVLIATSIKGKGKTMKGGITTEQRVSLENQLFKLLQPGDEVVKEDVAPGTSMGVTTGKIHGGIESIIFRRGLVPNLVNPNAVKKFVGVTGFKHGPGKAVRMTSGESKAAMKSAVLEHYGWTHDSHDVIDAYVMAQIALAVYKSREFIPLFDMREYQVEVVQSILQKREVIGK